MTMFRASFCAFAAAALSATSLPSSATLLAYDFSGSMQGGSGGGLVNEQDALTALGLWRGGAPAQRTWNYSARVIFDSTTTPTILSDGPNNKLYVYEGLARELDVQFDGLNFRQTGPISAATGNNAVSSMRVSWNGLPGGFDIVDAGVGTFRVLDSSPFEVRTYNGLFRFGNLTYPTMRASLGQFEFNFMVPLLPGADVPASTNFGSYAFMSMQYAISLEFSGPGLNTQIGTLIFNSQVPSSLVITPIPEPSTAAMLACGFLALLTAARRRVGVQRPYM
jgi:hypothetical protein